MAGVKMEWEDRKVSELCRDSREVGGGDLYIPSRGLHADGYSYMAQAQDRGAAAILAGTQDEVPQGAFSGISIPVIRCRTDAAFLQQLAKWFYRDPSSSMKVFGITGTNGKSTTAWLISQLLTSCGIKCGVLGTLGNGFLPRLWKTTNTTLGPVELERTLARMVREGAAAAAMEVSSIGISEGRVKGIAFEGVGFTNLTRDHLDYHGTMENYFEAKKSLFSTGLPCALNAADEWGRRILGSLKDPQSAFLYSADETTTFSGTERYVRIEQPRFLRDGMQFDLRVGDRVIKPVRTRLMGRFNLENIACAIALLTRCGFDPGELAAALPKARPVTGRMECFRREGRPDIVVDYAHTPDGVEKALEAAREHHPGGRVIAVVGCGGDRDSGKRPLMAIKASVGADEAIFTSDNPRSEDPETIIDDMMMGVAQAANVKRQADRRKAIEEAVAMASPDDVVVICGKGHEDYQIFKDRTIHFSDREIAAQIQGVELD
ncbi:MAG: UDP-N-acetylmuramoyl-L-alanyl-D-glutamate--2,6-diaminopimelate ligase [Succinivibrio sp.]